LAPRSAGCGSEAAETDGGIGGNGLSRRAEAGAPACGLDFAGAAAPATVVTFVVAAGPFAAAKPAAPDTVVATAVAAGPFAAAKTAAPATVVAATAVAAGPFAAAKTAAPATVVAATAGAGPVAAAEPEAEDAAALLPRTSFSASESKPNWRRRDLSARRTLLNSQAFMTWHAGCWYTTCLF